MDRYQNTEKSSSDNMRNFLDFVYPGQTNKQKKFSLISTPKKLENVIDFSLFLNSGKFKGISFFSPFDHVN